LVKLAHDIAAVIAQLPLGDLFGHARSVARVLHSSSAGVAASFARPRARSKRTDTLVPSST
jgi:hypothetical protein